jgi:hypothetical protein
MKDLIRGAMGFTLVFPTLIMSHQIKTAGESLEFSTVFNIRPFNIWLPLKRSVLLCLFLIPALKNFHGNRGIEKNTRPQAGPNTRMKLLKLTRQAGLGGVQRVNTCKTQGKLLGPRCSVPSITILINFLHLREKLQYLPPPLFPPSSTVG